MDALDEQALNDYLDGIVAEVGRMDILFNAMGPQPKEYGNNTSTLEPPSNTSCSH